MKLDKKLGLIAFAISLFAASTQTGAEAHGFGGHGFGGHAWGGNVAAAHFGGGFGGVHHFAGAHYGYGFRHYPHYYVNPAYYYANYVPNTVYVDAPNNVSADYGYGVEPNGIQIIETRPSSSPSVTYVRRQTVSAEAPVVVIGN